MKWDQWPCHLFIPRNKTCLCNEISTVKTCRTAHKILLFAGSSCHWRGTFWGHLFTAIVQLCTSTFCTTIILVAFSTVLLQEQPFSLPRWRGQRSVLWEQSKMDVRKLFKCRGIKGAPCKRKDTFAIASCICITTDKEHLQPQAKARTTLLRC